VPTRNPRDPRPADPRQVLSPAPNAAALKALISGREPKQLDRYLMQVRNNVAYARGSGVIDLKQFGMGIGRHLVDEVPLLDHNTYITLDEYVVETQRRQIGWSASSREIADALLGQHPRMELLMALIALNRIRKLPDQLAEVEGFYRLQLPKSIQAVYSGLMADRVHGPRYFLARQLILLAIREVLAYAGPIATHPDRGVISSAVMLTHALGSDLQEMGGGVKLWEGMASGDLMEIVQNGSFHAADDVMALLDRHWRVWFELGATASKEKPRASFEDLAREAIGLDPKLALLLGVALKTSTDAWRPGTPIAVQRQFVLDVDEADLDAFIHYTSSTVDELTAELAPTAGPWAFLPLEKTPILRLPDGLVVVDDTYLLKRVTDGLFLAVADMEGPPTGSGARRAWSRAYSEVVEAALNFQIEGLAPSIPVVGGGSMKTYFGEEEIKSAYIPKGKRGQGHKVCDAAVWLPQGAWLIFEIVNGELKVPSRQAGDMDGFAKDTTRLVIGKLAQLDATAEDLLRDDSKLTGLPRSGTAEIQPILIQGGHFPVHPVTMAYVDFRLKQERLLLHRARVRPLAILHWEELEILEAAFEQAEPVMDLLGAWQRAKPWGRTLQNWISDNRSDLRRPQRFASATRLRDILDSAAAAARSSAARGSL
jgi:hypothetical protein